MMAIAAIAYNTFLESIRKFELILFLLLGSALMISICYLTTNNQALEVIIKFMGEQEYVDISSPAGLWDDDLQVQRSILSYLKASGMFFDEVFTLIIAFSITLFLIPAEISSGAVLYILPKPVHRYQYILGKFFGALAIITICWWIMGLELFLFFMFREGMADPNLISAILILPVKFGILIAFMIALTTRLPSIVAGIISVLIFVGGHVSGKLQDLYLDPDLALEGFMRYAVQFAYYVVPHLHAVFSGTIMDPNENVLDTSTQIIEWVLYAVFYIAILLGIAILSFRRKSL